MNRPSRSDSIGNWAVFFAILLALGWAGVGQ